jgi:cytoskeletal protein CcmA (bactofilin family)
VRADPARDTSLSVSESGAILGPVQVRDLTLNGTVKGDIHAAGRLVLGATAKIEGNVYYGIIEMTLGAQIVGKLVCLEPQDPVEAPQGAPG